MHSCSKNIRGISVFVLKMSSFFFLFSGASKVTIAWYRVNCWYERYITLFKLYSHSQCTYPCFTGVFSPALCMKLFPSHWVPSHIHVKIIKALISNDSGMNPVTMPITNLQKHIGQDGYKTSNLWSQVLCTIDRATQFG